MPHSSPAPAIAASFKRVVRNLLVMRPLSQPRWPFSLRAGVCMAMPVLVGWLAGDTTAGLMAATGGFASLYGSGRPYLDRAALLGAVVLAFAFAVGLGNWVSHYPWAVVPTVAIIAMLATWMGNALRIGPPGAYMFMLACAAGSAMPAPHIGPAHAGLLVLAGGGFAWLTHMAGALFWPRRPEKAAVQAAGRAVVAYIESVAGPHEITARQQAALALHDTWQALVSFQPVQVSPDSTLSRLRVLNRELHLLFADVMGVRGEGGPCPPGALARANALALQANNPLPGAPLQAGDAIPLGHPGWSAALTEAIRPHSMSLLVIARVGVATLLAGALGAMLELERAYWAVAAAVLMLHQGLDWLRMVQRSAERVLGTWIGLLLAGLVLWWSPQGLWLVLVIIVLQFSIEMVVMRNYGLAVIFITSAGLTLAAGGHPVPELGAYLLARGVDTVVGCAVALLVYQLMAPRAAAALIPQQLARTLRAVAQTLGFLSRAELVTPAARAARRDLMHQTFMLSRSHDAALLASRTQREAAADHWPAIAATQQLAYRVLSACWAMERIGGTASEDAVASMFGKDGMAMLQTALDEMQQLAGTRTTLPPLPRLPSFIATEMAELWECLQHRGG